MDWTLADAERAKLTGKDNWAKFPKAMLRARVSADLCRAVFPDALMGVYDPDEMQREVPAGVVRVVAPAVVVRTTLRRYTQCTSQNTDATQKLRATAPMSSSRFARSCMARCLPFSSGGSRAPTASKVSATANTLSPMVVMRCRSDGIDALTAAGFAFTA